MVEDRKGFRKKGASLKVGRDGRVGRSRQKEQSPEHSPGGVQRCLRRVRTRK